MEEFEEEKFPQDPREVSTESLSPLTASVEEETKRGMKKVPLEEGEEEETKWSDASAGGEREEERGRKGVKFMRLDITYYRKPIRIHRIHRETISEYENDKTANLRLMYSDCFSLCE